MKIKLVILLLGFLNVYSQDSSNGIFAEFETSKGTIIAQLDYTIAPVTVANFITLAEGTNKYLKDEKLKGIPFYDGLKYHIVIKDYMILTGDHEGNGKGGTGYTVKGEFSREMNFLQGGYLAMDNGDDYSFSSQFFITHRNTEWFSGEKTIFGKVISGLDIVKEINQNDLLIKVTIKRVGDEAKSFDAVKVFDDYYTIKKPIEDEEAKIKQQELEAKKEQAKAQKIKADAEAKKLLEESQSVIKADQVKYFAEMKAKATTTPSGLKYIILKKGTGLKPVTGQTIYIHYAQFLEDGTLSGTNFVEVAKQYKIFNQKNLMAKAYNPFPFTIGQKESLLAGINEGIKHMNLGDKILLFIPSKLAYGTQGTSDIKPNTNLIFEIEILKSLPTE